MNIDQPPLNRSNAYLRNSGPIKTLLLCAALTVSTGVQVSAQTTDEDIANFAKTLPQEITRMILQRRPQYLQSLTQLVYQISPDGVATREAAQIYSDRRLAEARSRQITQFLRYDLDGDGNLTAAEIEIQTPYLSVQERGQLALWVLEGDTNSDKSLSMSEILSAARATVDQQNQQVRTPNIDTIMAFDSNADGRVDLLEIDAVMGAINPADFEELVDRRTALTPPPVSCTAPKPLAGTEVIFLSGYEGGAISTLAVSGQNVETSVGTVTITEGTAPLYIFATAYDSIVWKFDGATERVQQLVVQPRETRNGPGAAVAGIDADKITFVPPKSCIEEFMHEQNRKSDTQLTLLSRYLGRSFDHIVIGYAIRDFQVPPAADLLTSAEGKSSPYSTPVRFSIGDREYELSSTGMTVVGADLNSSEVTPTPRGLIRSMMRFYPGGLIALSPDEVHASAEIEPYSVLPQQAGLLQLVAEGSLSLIQERDFFIRAPILQFPAGLNGAHSVRFVLATGVPMPAGSPGHSQVTAEEAGECLVGRCR